MEEEYGKFRRVQTERSIDSGLARRSSASMRMGRASWTPCEDLMLVTEMAGRKAGGER